MKPSNYFNSLKPKKYQPPRPGRPFGSGFHHQAITLVLLALFSFSANSTLAQCNYTVILSADVPDYYICNGQTITLTTEVTGASAPAYAWYVGGVLQSNITNTLQATTADEYEVRVTDNGCTTTRTIDLLDGTSATGDPHTPSYYWTFDVSGTIDLADGNGLISLPSQHDQDAVDNVIMDYFNSNSNYPTTSGGQVNDYVQLDGYGTNAGSIEIEGNDLSYSALTRMTTEYLYKPDPNAMAAEFFVPKSGSQILGAYPSVSYRSIRIVLNNSIATPIMEVALNGVGRKSWDYYIDGNWHHFVVTADLELGLVKLYVDGVSPEGFQFQFAPDPNDEFNKSSAGVLKIGPQGAPWGHADFGGFDELAIYLDKAIPATLVYQHYQDAVNGKHYTFYDNTIYCTSVKPLQDALSLVELEYDPKEYQVGYDPNDGYAVANSQIPIDQIKDSPFPRYEQGNELKRNYPWYDYLWLAGREADLEGATRHNYAGPTNASVNANSGELNAELAEHWNYYTHIGSSTYDEMRKFANDHPEIPAYITTLWSNANLGYLGMSGYGNMINRTNLGRDHYLYSSAGTPNLIVNPTRPEASVAIDGSAQGAALEGWLAGLKRPVQLINENGEVLPIAHTDWSFNSTYHGFNSDVQNDFQTHFGTNTSDWNLYCGLANERIRSAYRDGILGYTPLLNRPETGFSYYSVDGLGGHTLYSFGAWNEIKNIQKNLGSDYLATPDFYPPNPSRWAEGYGAWHGISWATYGRRNELAGGDDLFSPFVSPGWDENPTHNIRPGQWLGFLKILGMFGAEFYYTGHFYAAGNHEYVKAYERPEHWAWQPLMPSYAQAISSRYEYFLREGSIVQDQILNITGINPVYKEFKLTAGGGDTYTMARKWVNPSSPTDIHYLIMSTKQRYSNSVQTGTSGVNYEKHVFIRNLDNQGIDLTVMSRQQGSTYIYRKDDQGGDYILIQLDEWHEPWHPTHWSKDFVFEAEVHDDLKQVTSNVLDMKYLSITTRINDPSLGEQPTPALGGDFTDFVTYYTFPNFDPVTHTPSDWGLTGEAPMLSYKFRVCNADNSTEDYGVNLRMRLKETATGTTGCYVRLMTADRSQVIQSDYVGCVGSTDWMWYTHGLCGALNFDNLEEGYYYVDIIPENEKLEIDRLILDEGHDLILPANQLHGSCGSWAPNNTPSYEVDFTYDTECDGNVQFTSYAGPTVADGCAGGVMYQWIFVNGSTQTTSQWMPGDALWPNGGTWANPIHTFSANDPNNEATLRVDFGNGIILSSAATLNIVQKPTVMVNFSKTSACVGETITASANVTGGAAPYSYTWYPLLNALSNSLPTVDFLLNEETNPTEDFKVMVTDNNGCQTEMITPITVNSPLSVSSNSPVVSVCDGDQGPVQFHASASGGSGSGYTYSWSPSTFLSSTTSSTPTASTGSGKLTNTLYTVTATDPLGCVGKAHVLLEANSIMAHTPDVINKCVGDASGFQIGGAVPCSTGTHTYKWTTKVNTGADPGLQSTTVLSPQVGATSGTLSSAGDITYTLTATDQNGNIATSSTRLIITSCGPVPPMATEEVLVDEGSIELFPNPSNGVFEVLFSGTLESESFDLELYDLAGNLIMTQSKQGSSAKLDVKHLSEGLYIVHVKNEEHHYQLRAFIR